MGRGAWGALRALELQVAALAYSEVHVRESMKSRALKSRKDAFEAYEQNAGKGGDANDVHTRRARL